MTLENAKWELELLIHSKTTLMSKGRKLEYDDDKRVDQLRLFIDGQNDVTIEQKQETTKPETSSDVPF